MCVLDLPPEFPAPTSAFFPGWICPISVQQKKVASSGGAAGSWQVHWKEYTELVGFITVKVLGTQSKRAAQVALGW